LVFIEFIYIYNIYINSIKYIYIYIKLEKGTIEKFSIRNKDAFALNIILIYAMDVMDVMDNVMDFSKYMDPCFKLHWIDF